MPMTMARRERAGRPVRRHAPRLARLTTATVLLLCLGVLPHRVDARQPASPAHGVVGISDAQLDPAYWVQRLPSPDAPLLDAAGVAAQNAAMRARDPSLQDLSALADTLDRAQVRGWIDRVSTPPTRTLYALDGRALTRRELDAIVANANLDAVPATQPTRFGLVVQRADLRAFPTAQRVFSSVGDTDIDRFQENALFPGDPVAITHTSADGRWWFVVSPRYAAWIEQRHVAEGTREQVLAYGARTPYRLVTGATVRTVFNPEQPAVSELVLDMGVRIPLRADWPADRPVHGQHPYAAHVLDLPVRHDAGHLRFKPALLPRSADSADAPLAATPRHLVTQAFRFLGERYGWGHAYNGRDCSGFVSEVYRSLGIELPRNTRDQAVSPALGGVVFAADDGVAAREAAVRALQVGDLVYIPGHVMMVIGHVDGAPYVIHDTTGISYRGADGQLVRMPLNQVAVTPLLPLMFNERERTIDRITAIRHVRR